MLFGTLIGFVFAVLVLAAPSSLKWNHEEDYEYSYKFDTHLLSGLPATHSNASQTGISCQVTIQAVDDTWLHLRMIGIKYGSSSNPQTEEWTMMDSLEQRQVVSDHKEQLELPFRAQMINGICTGIVFSKNDSDWSKNWKRSIVNLISMRKSNADLGDSDTSSEAYQSRTAKTEPTIEGECEVIYTYIGKGEKKTVTKLIQFDKCVARPGTEYGTPSNFGCKESQDGNQVKPRTTFTYQFVGNELKQSDVHSTYSFEAYGQVVLKSETRSRLVFETKQLIKTKIEEVMGPKESLVYSIREDINIEEFFKNGYDTKTNSFNRTLSDSKIAEFGNLVAMIPLVETNTPETSNVIAEAVEIIRMFTIKDLKTMHSEVYIKSEKKIQVLIESILAIAGTKNTIQHLMHQIKNNTISPLRAAELLKSIQETQYPSSHIADLLIDLAHSSLAEQHESLRQSAWLAIGSIIRGFTSSNQERHLFRENSSQITKKYYRVLLKEFEKADSTCKKVLALKAFGNAGLDISFNKLTQIIHDTRQQLPTRIEAVEALRLLSYRMVDQVQENLLKVFQDDQYAPELRSAALWRLMDTMPTESILDLIVAQMEHESDQQVAAVTYQIILHYSKSTDPCHSEFAVRCSDALAVTRYQPQPQLLSIMAQIPFLQNDLLHGIQLNFLTMFGKNAYLPKKVDVVLDSLFGGNWNKYAAQVGFSQQNFAYAVIKSFEKFNTITKTTKWAHANSEEFGYQRTDDMKNMNNSFLNQSTDIKDAYAAVYFRYKNMDYACLPIDMETIENLVNKYDKYGQVDVDFLRSLFNRNNEFELHRAAFFLETTRKIPTTMGVPLTISKKIPTVFSVQGNIGFELELLRARITLDATPSIVSTHITEMRFMSPMFENAVKSLQTANIYTPLRIEVIAELKTDFKLSWKVVAPGDKKAIATFTTTPVILNRFATNEKKSYVEIEETVVDPQHQGNVEQIENFYKVLEVNMVVRGNYSAQWTFAQVMMTEQNIQFTFENQNLPVEFAAFLNIRRIQNASPSEIEWDKIFEKEIDLEIPQSRKYRDYFYKIICNLRFGERSHLSFSIFAAPCSLKWQYEAGFEYLYKFNGLLLSSLPTTLSNATQTRISCQVTIQAIDNTWIYLKLNGIVYASASHSQTEEWTMMDSLEQRQVVSNHKELLQLPFRAQIIHGICSEIVFSEHDEHWSKNIKRSILNLISMRKSNADLGDYDIFSENIDGQFNTPITEPTIEGECEVIYTNIGKGEKKTVTKLIQFDKCVARPGTEYGTPSNFGCKESQDGNQVKPRTTFTYQFVGNELKQSDVHSTYSFEAYGQVVLKSETRSRLVFETKQLIKTKIEEVMGPKESLVYSIREDINIEEFFKNGDDTKTNSFNRTLSDSKIAEFGNLVAMIPLVETNTPETSNVVAEAVEIIRMFTIKDLKTMHSEVYIKSDKKIQVLIESILAIAGTKNTIQHLMHQIKNNTISPLRAAELLKSIQETQYPSRHIANLLINLADSSLAEQHESLRQSAWLAIGSIIRGFTSSNQERHLFRENSNQITKKYYGVLLKEFESADSTYKKVLALKAFGNAGLDISINKLTQVIHDTRQQLPTRIEAVEALRLLSYRMVDQVQENLLKVFQDDQYAPELRSAALWRLMDTMPTESILDLIVAQMEHESDQQVAAVTYQIILHYSKSTDPCHSEFAVRCSDALAVTRYQPQPQLLSIMAQIPFLQNDLLHGIQLNFLTMFGKNAYLPKKVDVVLDSLFGGNWNKYAAQVGFSQQNFAYAVIKSFEKFNTITKTTKWAHANSEEFGYQRTDDMKNMNNSFLNQSTDIKDAYATVYFRYKNMDYACLPIDMETIENLVNKYDKYGQVDVDFLRSLFNRNNEFELHRAAFFLETTRKIPTTMGVPLTISKKIPTVFSVQGNIGFELELLRARITLDATPSIVSTHITEMRFMSPMFENAVKSLQTANIYTPLRIEVIAELKTDFKLSWKVVAPGDKKAIATFTTTPVILNRFATNEKKSYVEIEETVVDPQHQGNVEQIENFYKVLEVNMVVRGNYSAQWTFAQVMMTEQNIQFTFENQNLPVEFAAYLNIGRIEFDQIFEKKSDLETPPSETCIGHFYDMIRNVQFGERFRHLIILKLEATQKFEMTFELETVCDSEVPVCKWKLDCRRSPVRDESEKWTLNTKLVASRPHMSACRRQLRELENLEIHFVLNIKWGNNKKTEITINGKLEQSEEQKEYVRGLKREINGSPENKTLIKAINLNQLNIVSEYTSTQKIVFDRFFDYIKPFNYWTSLDLSDENKNKRVTVQFTVEPISRQFVNITIQTTQQSFELRNVPVPSFPLIPSTHQPTRRLLVDKTDDTCHADRKFSTFDEKDYSTSLLICSVLFAEDCNADSKSAFLAKKLTKRSTNLESEAKPKLVIKLQDNSETTHEFFETNDQNEIPRTLDDLNTKICTLWQINAEHQQLFFETNTEIVPINETILQSLTQGDGNVLIVKHSLLSRWDKYMANSQLVLANEDLIEPTKDTIDNYNELKSLGFFETYVRFNSDDHKETYDKLLSSRDGEVGLIQKSTKEHFQSLHDKKRGTERSKMICRFEERDKLLKGRATNTLAFVQIHGENSVTKYNVKCHHFGPKTGNLMIGQEPDIIEFFCYKLLAKIGVGPETTIIPPSRSVQSRTSTYIATQWSDEFEIFKRIPKRTLNVEFVIQFSSLKVFLFLNDLHTENVGRWNGTNNAAIVDFAPSLDFEVYENITATLLTKKPNFYWADIFKKVTRNLDNSYRLNITMMYLKKWNLTGVIESVYDEVVLLPAILNKRGIELKSRDGLNDPIDQLKEYIRTLRQNLENFFNLF